MCFRWWWRRRWKKIYTRKITICLMITCSNLLSSSEHKRVRKNERKRVIFFLLYYILSGITLLFVYNGLLFSLNWHAMRMPCHSIHYIISCKPKPHDWRFCNTIRAHAAQFPWPLRWVLSNTVNKTFSEKGMASISISSS